MARFLLIRHGDCEPVGKYLAGRKENVHLNANGRRQAECIADGLAETKIDHLFSSPLERAVETAERIARVQNTEIRTDEAFLEIDYGDWTGMSFEKLASDDLWSQFNRFRSSTRVPGGEMMIEVQKRFVSRIKALHDENPESVVGIVSHSDPIKSALCGYAGISLDLMHRLVINPASVSAFDLSVWGAEIQFINRTGGF
ncbi:MAG: histidine phosphatase family protein [Chitinispirillaceae bacterium]